MQLSAAKTYAEPSPTAATTSDQLAIMNNRVWVTFQNATGTDMLGGRFRKLRMDDRQFLSLLHKHHRNTELSPFNYCEFCVFVPETDPVLVILLSG